MRVHRRKPYVCIECDFEDHVRFLSAKDLDTTAGVWLRCLAHSRRQELDGVVPRAWLRRAYAGKRMKRVDELVRVGLLLQRDDGDYELRAYAPRNQTKAMLSEERGNTRERVRALRASRAQEVSPEESAVTAYKRVSNAIVPTSTSISTSTSLINNVTDLDQLTEIQSSKEGRVQRGEDRPPAADPAPVGQPTGVHPERPPLPVSEKAISGNYWLAAFTEGISRVTKRPCTAGRMYVTTLERIVGHHAPERAAPQACVWLREQAKAFAKQWDGKHPPKGLTPDGLERWLNEGRQGPPEFGPKRIVQLPADQWTFDDDELKSLGAKVIR